MIAGRYTRFTLSGDPVLQEGNRLLEQFACRRCHVIGGRGERLSVNLDHAADRRSPDELVLSIQHPVQNMPDFRITEQQATALINALFSATAQQVKTTVARPQVVHFDLGAEAGKDVFSIKCGACHRLLTGRWGALGRGAIGPNLSGLLSAFYPKTFRDTEAWDETRLRRWLENPRAVKADARMQPVRLSEAELTKLLDLLRGEQTN